MSLRRPADDAVLTGEEVQLIRQALVTCSRVLTWAGEHAGPQFRDAVAGAAEAAAGERRCPGWLEYTVSLAIDYLDFAPAARGRR
jgi:hypothetical protein